MYLETVSRAHGGMVGKKRSWETNGDRIEVQDPHIDTVDMWIPGIYRPVLSAAA